MLIAGAHRYIQISLPEPLYMSMSTIMGVQFHRIWNHLLNCIAASWMSLCGWIVNLSSHLCDIKILIAFSFHFMNISDVVRFSLSLFCYSRCHSRFSSCISLASPDNILHDNIFHRHIFFVGIFFCCALNATRLARNVRLDIFTNDRQMEKKNRLKLFKTSRIR